MMNEEKREELLGLARKLDSQLEDLNEVMVSDDARFRRPREIVSTIMMHNERLILIVNNGGEEHVMRLHGSEFYNDGIHLGFYESVQGDILTDDQAQCVDAVIDTLERIGDSIQEAY